MDPYPRSHSLVRGGFSPIAGGWTPRHSGMAGLGDSYACDVDGNCSDTTTGTPFTVGWVPVAIGGGTVPQYVYIAGGILLLFMLMGGKK